MAAQRSLPQPTPPQSHNRLSFPVIVQRPPPQPAPPQLHPQKEVDAVAMYGVESVGMIHTPIERGGGLDVLHVFDLHHPDTIVGCQIRIDTENLKLVKPRNPILKELLSWDVVPFVGSRNKPVEAIEEKRKALYFNEYITVVFLR